MYASSCVIAAVAFLESHINELFSDAAHVIAPFTLKFAGYDAKVLKKIGDSWRDSGNKTPPDNVMKKYQKALELAGGKQFEENQRPSQDIDALLALRNLLLHFETEWMLETTGMRSLPRDAATIEKRTKGRFRPSPLAPKTAPYFPDRCFSADCAQWAVESSKQYVEEFRERVGLTEFNFNQTRKADEK